MDEAKGDKSMRFLSLNIKDCLGCSDVSVSFPQSNSVHVLLYKPMGQEQARDTVNVAVTPVAQAIQLLCTRTFPDAESLERLPLLEVGRGSVSLRFQVLQPAPSEEDSDSDLDLEPSTSAQARVRLEERKKRHEAARNRKKIFVVEKEVMVERRFNDPQSLDWVTFTVNGGEILKWQLDEFHAQFFEDPQYSSIHLWDLQHKCAGNWLQIIRADGNGYKNFQTPGNPFEIFAKLFVRKELDEEDLVCKLAESCITVNEAVLRSERQFVMQVFNHVRGIFEYFTMKQYTVWFLVPGAQGPQSLTEEVYATSLFSTCFSLRFPPAGSRLRFAYCSHFHPYCWRQQEHLLEPVRSQCPELADGLLPVGPEQSLLIISHLDKIADFVTWQFITASHMNDIYARGPTDSKWVCMRYLQRIVEMAQANCIIVLIEYPSFLSILSDERHVIKCEKQPDKESWDVKVASAESSESRLEILKNAINLELGSVAPATPQE
ncbi:protein ORD-like [Drosophila miranda]|uniref:protein ORD-like n=2 Tax=Drosophila miranda TaxID=7229 RepID=UPI00143F2342|nr:protein ORD-like [Drosophila miranda]